MPPLSISSFSLPQALAQAVAPIDSVEIDWWAQIQQGGVVSLVQGFLLLALIAFSMERYFTLKQSRFSPAGLLNKSLSLHREQKTNEIAAACREDPSTLGNVLAFVIDHPTAEPQVVAESMQDIAQREIEVQYEKLAVLSLIAASAPLLGLLGTMIGMIESFQLVAIYGDEGGAALLADSIAKALITTAVGLVIAIPALFIHHFLKRRVQKIAKRLEADLERIYREWFLRADTGGAEQPVRAAETSVAQ